MRTFEVSIARKQTHQSSLGGLGLVHKGLGANLQASHLFWVNVVCAQQLVARVQTDGVDIFPTGSNSKN